MSLYRLEFPYGNKDRKWVIWASPEFIDAFDKAVREGFEKQLKPIKNVPKVSCLQGKRTP